MTVLRPVLGAEPELFRHTWEGLVNVDQFRWMVRADMLEQLKIAHDELGARHVRAVGMLDDEMRVLTRDPVKWRSGEHVRDVPNWQIDTYITERLADIGILPMITTCFMPGALAAGERTTFETKARISLPSDWAAWRRLAGGLVRHLEDHFGAETVRGMYFEIWNEPNLRNGFLEGTQEDFFRLYLETAGAIKDVDPELRVGGPSTARAGWIEEFLEFGRRSGLEPDYMISHVYNEDCSGRPVCPFDGPDSEREPGSPHFARGVVRGVRKVLDSAGFRGEMHWNEWGRTWWPCDGIRESANEAAFIVKTMSEVSQLGDKFAYWCLSDIYDQVGYSGAEFCGNYGLLSLHGLKKPGYHAHSLLGRLGMRRVPVEGCPADGMSGAVCTADSPGDVRLLAYSFDPSPEPDLQASGRMRVEMPSDMRVKRMTVVSDSENNILHDWRQAGSPAYVRRELLEELRAVNELRETRSYCEKRSGDVLTVDFDMPCAGIAMIEFEKM